LLWQGGKGITEACTRPRRNPDATPLAIRPLTEGAYAALRHGILTSRLAPGSKLVLDHLKDQLQIGIAPIREALARLAGEGLVDTESQRGFWVSPVSVDELQQLGELRSTMEVMAFRHTMEKDHRLLQDRLGEAWRLFKEVGQRAGETEPLNDKWDERHLRFHTALFCGYESPATLRIYVNIYARMERYRRLGIDRKGFLAGVIDDHSRLLEHVGARDIEGGSQLIRRHIHDVVEIVRSNVGWTEPRARG
jgi:GntR family carbon starvation induced transcriptional regulator